MPSQHVGVVARDRMRPAGCASSSCSRAARRAFWKYPRSHTFLLFDRGQPESCFMRKQHPLNNAGARKSGSRRSSVVHSGTVLAIGVMWLVSAAAIAQSTMPGTQPPAGMLATSPLNPQSTRPVGIPLGSTEIATPGISPISPAQSTMGCAGSGNASSTGALFDGGGLSGGPSTDCASSAAAASPLPSTSTLGRVGIPLGATEIGGAGISPTVPVPGPTSTVGTTSIDGSGNP